MQNWGLAMTGYDLGVEVTEEMLAVRDTVHRFASEVMRPVGVALDEMHDPAEVIAEDSPLWGALQKYRELGLVGQQDAYDPDLSPAQRALLHCMVLEETCRGDVGLSITLSLFNMAPMVARNFGNEEAEKFFDERDEICCLALTEPNHGSDHVGFTEPTFFDGTVRTDCRITRDGDDFIVNGQKSSWVSAGTVAGAIILMATFEEGDQGIANGALFVIPADLPGLTKGKPLDKMGQRSLNQGEIFFDNVRVPRKFLMAEGADVYPIVWEFFLKDANLAMGMQFVGVARAAYDMALEYAQERVQGGVPIIQHQNIKLRLFDMFTKVETARSHIRRLAVNQATNENGISYQEAATAKVYATQAAFEVADAAIQTFGGYGLCREYPIEKVFRDARAGLIQDGENSMLKIMAASRL